MSTPSPPRLQRAPESSELTRAGLPSKLCGSEVKPQPRPVCSLSGCQKADTPSPATVSVCERVHV